MFRGPLWLGEPGSPPREFVRYSSGDLERLLREAQPGVYLFSGPDPLSQAADQPDTIDIEQLEAVRALGYLGDDE